MAPKSQQLPLRVLGDRVLVKPDINTNAPEILDSGVIVAKSLAAAVTGEDATLSVCRGRVVSLGRPSHPLQHEAETLARAVESRARVRHDGQETPERDAALMLRDLVRRRPCVSIGDDVLFSHDAGQEILIDDVAYVILHEHELLAVVVPNQSGPKGA